MIAARQAEANDTGSSRRVVTVDRSDTVLKKLKGGTHARDGGSASEANGDEQDDTGVVGRSLEGSTPAEVVAGSDTILEMN